MDGFLIPCGGLEREDRRGIAVVAFDLRGRETVVVGRRLFLFLNVRKPIAWRLPLTFCDLEKHFLNLLGDWATTTSAHRNVIN